MEVDKDKPVYVISVVAEMLDIPQQTLRIYEKANLVTPKRSNRNTRLYSIRDVEKLQRIVSLHQELGINLAGIEVILHMRFKMESLQDEYVQFVEFVRRKFGEEFGRAAMDENSTDLVPLSDEGAHIMRIIDSQFSEFKRHDKQLPPKKPDKK